MDYLQLTETERFMVGHQLRDLISGCTFRGLDCLTTIDSDDEDSFLMDYEAVWSPIYGNCFDIFAADESFGKSSLTGASYGLSLELQVRRKITWAVARPWPQGSECRYRSVLVCPWWRSTGWTSTLAPSPPSPSS